MSKHIAANKAASHEKAVTTIPTLPVTAPSSRGLTRMQTPITCTMMAWLSGTRPSSTVSHVAARGKIIEQSVSRFHVVIRQSCFKSGT
jgi:hypothetical protein